MNTEPTFLESDVNPRVLADFQAAYERHQIEKNRRMWRSLVIIGLFGLAFWMVSR